MRLGEILLERKQITADDLERGLELQKERGDKLGRILVDLGFVAQRDMLAALADQLGVALVTIEERPPSTPETEGLSVRFLRQFRCLPLAVDESGKPFQVREARPAARRKKRRQQARP